jgi:hypothetical protein
MSATLAAGTFRPRPPRKSPAQLAAEREAMARLQRSRIVQPPTLPTWLTRLVSACELEWRDGPCRPIGPAEKRAELHLLMYGACALGTLPGAVLATVHVIDIL